MGGGGAGAAALTLMTSHFILYVADQARSRRFYARVLALEPRLDVPGMTEFALPGGGILGLMPEAGIRSLLGAGLPAPSPTAILRSELYLRVPDPEAGHRRALEAGARELSPFGARSWGHSVGYSLDPDGHVLAFASPAADELTGDED